MFQQSRFHSFTTMDDLAASVGWVLLIPLLLLLLLTFIILSLPIWILYRTGVASVTPILVAGHPALFHGLILRRIAIGIIWSLKTDKSSKPERMQTDVS